MPLLNEDTFFIHIPKTGGTSIERAFGINTLNHKPRRDILYGRDNKLPGLKWLQHLYYCDVKDLIEKNGYKVVTVVRNPYDRMISIFHFLTCVMSTNTDRMRDQHFSKFVESYVNAKNSGEPSYTQSDFLEGADLSKITIFRYENLERDFQNYFGKPLWFHELKSVRSTNIPAYYNERTAKIVREMFKKDFEKFGYSMEL